MANPEQLEILEQGVEVWNEWRKKNPTVRPHLVGANLVNMDLTKANFVNGWLSRTWLDDANLMSASLSGADLREARLNNVNLSSANLRHADLKGADLTHSNLSEADLSYANFSNAILRGTIVVCANLTGAILNESDFSDTNLSRASLLHASLHSADLSEADLNEVVLGWTYVGDTDLSLVKGLDTIHHTGPSTIGVDTIYKSKGKIPRTFLAGCGLPDSFITFIPSLTKAEQAIQLYSCFISYSHKDEEFVKKLHSRLQDAQLNVWFAPEDMSGGEKIYEQIDSAIKMHDRLLLVLSKESMESEWVKTEIRKTRRVEIQERRRKLFPIRLVDYNIIREWECFDVDLQKDLALEIREYFIPDFSNWKNPNDFEASVSRLLRDLKSDALKKSISPMSFLPMSR